MTICFTEYKKNAKKWYVTTQIIQVLTEDKMDQIGARLEHFPMP
jgi:hypothetical protein